MSRCLADLGQQPEVEVPALDHRGVCGEMKEDTMVMTLLGFRAVMAELHKDDRRPEARTSKVRTAQRRRRV
jgi:hypothetical protein